MSEVIYAAYGSNLLKERLMAYINGSEFEGKLHKGCYDKSEPIDLGCRFIPYKLYFAKNSPHWDYKGVAFLFSNIEPDQEYHTLVRLWRIEEDQFYCIHCQEGKGYYTHILSLGVRDGIEIKTISGNWHNEIKSPSRRYVNIIIRGLKETVGWNDIECDKYLKKFIL